MIPVLPTTPQPKPAPTALPASDPITKYQLIIAQSGLFDHAWYLAQQPDLGNPPIDPIVHYLTIGVAEGRSPNSLFSTNWYLETYPDVAANGINPLVHYIAYGASEGRLPNPLFDSRWYLDSYPDVAHARINPLSHFLHWGAAERRKPHRLFNTQSYAANHLATADPDVNPLAHYLTEGYAKGFTPFEPEQLYSALVLRQQQKNALEINEVLRHIAVMVVRPRFHVLIEGVDEHAYERTFRSLQNQLYGDWTATSFKPMERVDSAFVDGADDTYVIWMQAGDMMSPRALYAFAAEINHDPDAQLVYLDEDRLADDESRGQPFFKPDWSPDYLEAINFIGPAACFRIADANRHLAVAHSYYDFVLRFTESSRKHLHVREVLYHRMSAASPNSLRDAAADIAALEGRLARTGRTGIVTSHDASGAVCDVSTTLARTPRVSVILAISEDTRNAHDPDAIVNTVATAIDSIMVRSTYRDIEIICVVDAIQDPSVHESIRFLGCTVVTSNADASDHCSALNLGAQTASGELLLFMNSALASVSERWIERLVAQFEKPHVGAAGSKLLSRDGTTVHAGIVLNAMLPSYVRNENVDDQHGYFGSWIVNRNCLAVSSACMMTRAHDFRATGGFDSRFRSRIFRDLDYCLKLDRLAKTSVFVPAAALIMSEPLPAQTEWQTVDADALQAKWGATVGLDPFYNEQCLTVGPPTFELSLNKLVG